MKIILTIFVLFFSSSVFANDIRDFQIEGMSIGDSLLDYFSEEIIKNNIDDDEFIKLDPNPKYVTVYLEEVYLKKYDFVQIHVLNRDKKYKIYSIQAKIFKDFENCEKNKKEIGEELSIVFKNQKKVIFNNKKLTGDNIGKSTYSGIAFKFLSGDFAGVYCYDWSKEFGKADNLKVFIDTPEFLNWLRTKAYK